MNNQAIFYKSNYRKLVTTLIEQKHFDKIESIYSHVNDQVHPSFYAIGTKDGNTIIKLVKPDESSDIKYVRELKCNEYNTINDIIRNIKSSNYRDTGF